jgi:hypothetical protein
MQRFNNNLLSLAAAALILSHTAPAAATVPDVKYLPASPGPAVPAGTHAKCWMGGGPAATPVKDCPVVRINGVTYWPLSYNDGRNSLAIVGYDANGKAVSMVEKPGITKPWGINILLPGYSVVFRGANNVGVTMTAQELSGSPKIPAPPPPPKLGQRWDVVAGPPGGVKAAQVSVGSASNIWILDTTGVPWRYSNGAWTKGVGYVQAISATADGALWATNPPDSYAVLRWDAVNKAWAANVQYGMTKVAAHGANMAWGLDDGGNHHLWDGSKWVKQGCCVVQISAGSDGELWATNPGDQYRVLRWNGAAWDLKTPLAPIPAGMREVAVGGANHIWALDPNSYTHKWTGTGWQKVPGALKGIAVGADGTTWGVDHVGVIYKFIP